MSRGRLFAPVLLAVLGLLIFGPHAPHAGLHLDDHGFHMKLAAASWDGVWSAFRDYVPGRNLYILYYAAMYKVLGPEPARLHLFGLLLDLANVVLALALFRQLGLARWAALLAAGLFLVYPNHAETHFWTSAIAMNLLSTTFVLAAFLCAGAGRLAPAFAFFALALFDYDQAFFMWPLILWRARRAKGARWFAAGCLALNAAHLLMRLYFPNADPGNPKPAFGLFLSGLHGSLSAALVPLQKLPKWELLHSWAGGPAATVILVVVLSACFTAAVARLRRKEPAATPVPASAAYFGLAWFFSAYLPNYFWFISARHNYLPSLGTALLLSAAAAAALSRRGRGPWTARALAACAFLFFGISAAANLGEGYSWTLSGRLHEKFRAEAPKLLAPKPDNLFLLGAPDGVGRGAPGFRSPDEALHLFHQATGHYPPEGGLTAAFGRAGIFYWNRPDLLGRNAVRRRAYAGMNLLLAQDGGGFSCAKSVVVGAAGSYARARVRGGPACAEDYPVEAPVWLLSSDAAPARGKPLFVADNGAALLSVRAPANRHGSHLEIEFTWTAVKRLDADFAFLLSLSGPGGTVMDSSYRPAPRAPAALWPSYDELHPPSSWRPGQALRERFLYRLDGPRPPGPLEARIALYALKAGAPWRFIGEHRTALAD